MRPVIGITTSIEQRPRGPYLSLNENYAWSVTAAGGLPFPIPLTADPQVLDADEWLEPLDGILFSGGADLAPTLYGEDPIPNVEIVSPLRDERELGLFEAARKRGIPILGICRGLQLINVAMGGTLIQDIATQVPGASGHYPDALPMSEPYHRVRVTDRESRLWRALGLDQGQFGPEDKAGFVMTNSFHHQSVRDLAKGLHVTARSLDGIVEGFEGDASLGFMMAVQFHPETLTRNRPEFLGIFAALVDAGKAWSAIR